MANYSWNSAQINQANARIAAGEVTYPKDTTATRVEDGAVLPLIGVGSSAYFGAGQVVSAAAPSNGDGRADGTIYIQSAS